MLLRRRQDHLPARLRGADDVRERRRDDGVVVIRSGIVPVPVAEGAAAFLLLAGLTVPVLRNGSSLAMPRAVPAWMSHACTVVRWLITWLPFAPPQHIHMRSK